MYLFGSLNALVDPLGVLPAPITSPAAGFGAALSGARLGGVLAVRLRTSAKFLSPHVDLLVLATAEPLGCDLHELLGVGPPQWREFPPLGRERPLPISLVAPYKVCERRER